MKKLIILSAAVFYLFSSCNEIMPTIPPIGNPEILSDRKVLIEEFTGVGCVNCPAGSKEIENLLGRFPKNLIAISIHAGFFSKPYIDSKYDFRTDDADDLVNTYFGGEPFAYPSATINRQKTETNTFYVDSREWPGGIESELDEETALTLDVDSDFSNESRTMNAEVTINPKVDLSSDLRITVLITENGVTDYQLLPDPDGWTEDYEHKHMLREIITPFDGEQLSASGAAAGDSFTKTYSFTLPQEWKPEKCEVIAFVHRDTPDSKEVLNAEKAKVAE